jgi:uncharacterized protein YgiM (DUF1202 family)
MQAFYLKKIIFFCLVTLSFSQLAQSQSNKSLEQEAKKLYNEKKVIACIAKYEQLWKNKENLNYSELRRLAYLKSKTGDYTENLYILSLMLKIEPNALTYIEINNLAEELTLEGYSFSEFDLLYLRIAKYRIWLLSAVLIFSLFFIGGALYGSYKRKPFKTQIKFVFLVFIGSVLTLLVYSTKQSYLIVKDETVQLRNSPSAASQIVANIKKGNKFKIKAQKDIWYEIESNELTGYIRVDQVWRF